MGWIVAKAYRTTVAGNLADHTYVECGTGAKGWGCWGGKSGGMVIGRGFGSTHRSDVIAEPDERAGITCYAINGVCHQAANRILMPVFGEVVGARGYGLSVALYGVYGRPSGPLRTCAAPLLTHTTIGGDLPECMLHPAPALAPTDENTYPERTQMLAAVASLYEEQEWHAISRNARIGFQLAQFRIFAMYRLGRDYPYLTHLLDIQRWFEGIRTTLEDQWASRQVSRLDFAQTLNRMTINYQNRMAEVLPPDSFAALLDCDPAEKLVVCDPELLNNRPGPGPERFTPRTS